MRAPVVVLLVAALGVGCGGDDDPEATASGCDNVESPAPREAEVREAPTARLESGKAYALGGPGYSTADVPPSDARYTKGTMAMAKSAIDPPGTAGSQFFVVTADDAGLPPEYAVVGAVTGGLDIVERIGELGDPATEQPTQPVVIRSVTVDES